MDQLQRAVFAADVRDSFLEVALCGWKARDAGLSQMATLEVIADSMEELGQSIVRAADR